MHRSIPSSILTLFVLISSCSQNPQSQTANNPPEKPIQAAEWELVWSDEFDGDKIDTNNWTHQVLDPGTFNEEWQAYTDQTKNAYLEGGNLIIKAIHESDNHGMGQYTSARLNTANKQSWKYGKVSARIRLPYSEGIWPAFWMLGANIDENGGDQPWPQCGEIDILELYGSHDDAVVEANAHFANTANEHSMMGAKSYKLDQGIFADDYHVFDLIWNEKELIWLVDGNEYANLAISSDEFKEFHQEFFILLNIAVGGTWAGRPSENSVFPQMMYVDWVRVYQQTR